MEGSLSSVRTYVVHLYDPAARNYTTQELNDISHDEAIVTARALARTGRVDLWLGNSKIGSFPAKLPSSMRTSQPFADARQS